MKKLTLIILVLLLLAAAPVAKLMRLEVINKSNSDAVVILTELDGNMPADFDYYLPIEAGGALPEVRLFTVPKGLYNVQVIACGVLQPSQFENLDLNKGYFRFVILPCEVREAVDGDGNLKFNPYIYPAEDPFGAPLVYDLGGKFRYRY